MVALDVGHHALEHGVGMRVLGPDSHVLLAEMLELGLDRDGLLEAAISISHSPTLPGMHQHTSCSASGTFLSFSLWTAAWAEPSSTAAVSRAPFMLRGSRAR